MTSHNVTKNFPHGLTNTFNAPLSGRFTQSAVETALGNLPDNLAELRKVWQSIDSVRNSGLVSVRDGGRLDDAVRSGVWGATLQQRMPTVGGLPGSRGILQNWPHYNTDNYYAHILANHSRKHLRRTEVRPNQLPACAVPAAGEMLH